MGNHEKDIFDRELGFRLKKLRQMRRMSQQDLGAMLGVSFQQIQRYETGANRMPPERIYHCAHLLGVNIGYFFGLMDNDRTDGHGGDGKNGEQFDKRVLTMASSIVALPSDDIARAIYQLTRSINMAFARYNDRAICNDR